MRSYQLRHKIRIQRRTRSLDPYGQPQESWEDYLSVRAHIRPVSGKESAGGLSVNPSLTHTIAVRYKPAFGLPLMMASNRVRFGERVFNIESVRNLEERNRWVILNCIEGSVDGQ
jgi:SPP1 family predicted phage head-tail adaptor